MKTCLFCRNTRIFNITNDFGNNHTAKDDMLEFFGHHIEGNLRDDDAICNLCMNIMDNVAKLKRRLLPLIYRSDPSDMEDSKPINFGKKWDVFASMNFEDEDNFLESRSPTPSKLLLCKRVVPYRNNLEMKIAEIERQRSLSRISLAKSDADSEIINAFSNKRSRRRKRGHGWSRRKMGRYSSMSTSTRRSITSTHSRRSFKSRPLSVISTLSTESYESLCPFGAMEVLSPTSVQAEKNTLQYVEGCLQNKRTRSVSKQLEEQITVQCSQEVLYPCPTWGCGFVCENIDFMAKHRIEKHDVFPWFLCTTCGKRYTRGEELRIHKKVHMDLTCVICRKHFYFDQHLVEHWQKHVQESVPCKICGKRFVDKAVCNKHQRNVHKRKIPSRIDYNKTVQSSSMSNKDFEVRIMIQDGVNLVEDC